MIIGRERESKILENALQESEAKMIMVQGEYGVGKTSLIKKIYKDCMLFELRGVKDGTKKAQLCAFTDSLQLLSDTKIDVPKNWQYAFFQLEIILKSLVIEDKKQVIFFDDISWLTTPNSRFIEYLGHFWITWASRKNVVVVICDSDISWVTKNVIRVKGGLHNRISRYINMVSL